MGNWAETLAVRGIPVPELRLEQAVDRLVRERWLVQDVAGYGVADEVLAGTLWAHEGETALRTLARTVGSEHPLVEMTRGYLAEAGFAVVDGGDATQLVCTPRHRVWQEHFARPVGVKVAAGLTLDMGTVAWLVDGVAAAPVHVVVVCDEAPLDEAWLQIGTLRARDVFVMPVDDTVLVAGLQGGRPRAVLLDHLEARYLGPQRDLYDRQNPIADRLNFFGREGLAAQLSDDLARGHAVALFGLRKMGKSSLLAYVRDQLPYGVAVVDLEVGTDFGELATRILRGWTERLRTVAPALAWQPPEIGVDEAPTAYFGRAVRGLLTALDEAGADARLAVFVDEIELVYPMDEAAVPPYLDFARTLRGLAQEYGGRFGLMVAGVDPKVVRTNRLFGQQNPFYNFFRVQYLPPLSEADCGQMVRNIGVQMGLDYVDEAVAFVAQASGGHPYWARKLCSLAFQAWQEPGPMTLGHLVATARRFIQHPDTAQLLDQRGL